LKNELRTPIHNYSSTKARTVKEHKFAELVPSHETIISTKKRSVCARKENTELIVNLKIINTDFLFSGFYCMIDDKK